MSAAVALVQGAFVGAAFMTAQPNGADVQFLMSMRLKCSDGAGDFAGEPWADSLSLVALLWRCRSCCVR